MQEYNELLLPLNLYVYIIFNKSDKTYMGWYWFFQLVDELRLQLEKVLMAISGQLVDESETNTNVMRDSSLNQI